MVSVSESKNSLPAGADEQPSINVEVVYAMAQKQVVRKVNVDAGTTLGAAIVQSGIMMDFPDLELENAKVGVYGKAVSMVTVIKEGDRIEIYRPLIADPKEVRRRRAAEGKAMKKGGRAETQPSDKMA